MLVTISMFCNSLNTGSGQATLVVGIDQSYAPHEFLDPKTEDVRGFNVDIVKAIANKMSVSIEWRPMKWKDAFESLRNGSIDCLNMATKAERKEFFDFSIHTLNLSLAIFVRESEVGLAELSDLAGRTVAVEEEDISHLELQERVPDVIIVPVDNHSAGLRLLQQGDVTAFFGNLQTATYYITLEKLGGIKIIGEKVEISPRSIAVQKGDPLNILTSINDSLKLLFSSGEYNTIYEKWFGRLINQTDNNNNFITILIIIVGLFASIGIISIINNKILQHRVETTERELQESEYVIKTLTSKIPFWTLIIQDNTVKYSNFYYGENVDLNRPFKEVFLNHFSENDYERIIRMFNQEYFELEIKKDDKSDKIEYYDIRGSKITFETRPALLLIIENITEHKLIETLRENFIAIASHELRTPLTVIKAATEFFINNPNDEAKVKLLEIMQKNVNRLHNLIDNVTTYSKIKTEVFKLSLEKKTYAEVITNITDTLKLLYSKRKVIIEDEWINDDDILFIDEEHLNQAIQNLVENAIKHSPQDSEIKIVFQRNNDDLIVRVEDEGAGIEKKNIEKISKPFVTIESKYSCTGTGLGLYIVKTIVEMMGGNIKVESEVGKGSRFEIFLPKVFQ